MVAFAGVSHVAFTVSDLTVSQRFYTSVLDFVAVLDVGYGRICMHPATGFTIGLIRHEGASGERFSELGEKLIAIFEERNEANDGTLRLPQEYLQSLIRL